MRLSARRGFTLVELLVAVLLIDVGVLALVAGSAIVVRRDADVRARDRAAHVASNRLQTLAALPCATIGGDTALALSLHETWSATPGAASTRTIRDSVSFTSSDGPRSIVLESITPC